MTYIVKGFEHHPGVHCGSTALTDVMNYYGFRFTEAMCFGLACGLDFVYMESDQLSPTRFINGRCASLEPTLFKNIGVPFEWNKSDYFPWDQMKQELLADRPILLLTDLYYLDYYKTNTHFGGHGVVLVGFDEEERVAFLADTERPGLQKTAIDSLAKAMSSKETFFVQENNWKAIAHIPAFDLNHAVAKALLYNANRFLNPEEENRGLVGLRLFAERLPDMKDAKDSKWVARFAYQAIEKRGTGGGSFRKLYGDFLAEAEALPTVGPALQRINASERMHGIAGLWTHLAGELKKISESENHPDFSPLKPIVEQIWEQEQHFFTDILETLAK